MKSSYYRVSKMLGVVLAIITVSGVLCAQPLTDKLGLSAVLKSTDFFQQTALEQFRGQHASLDSVVIDGKWDEAKNTKLKALLDHTLNNVTGLEGGFSAVFKENGSVSVHVVKQEGCSVVVVGGADLTQVRLITAIVAREFGHLEKYTDHSLPIGKSTYVPPKPVAITPITAMDNIQDGERRSSIDAGEQFLSQHSFLDEHQNKVSPLAMLLLNGGLGTRMASDKPKGLVSIVKGWLGKKDFSMLELHLREILAMEKKYDVKIHVYIMTSFQTDKETLATLKSMDVDMRYVHVYSQGLVARKFMKSEAELEAKFKAKKIAGDWMTYRDKYVTLMTQYGKTWGDDLPKELGPDAFNPPGHMDTQISAVLTGVVDHMKRHHVEFINQVNIHHTVVEPRMTELMMGQKLQHRDNKVILHVSESPKAGGGLYNVALGDDREARLVLDDSVMEYYAANAADGVDQKAYLTKMKEASAAQLTSVANYLYSVEVFHDRAKMQSEVEALPSFEDIKKIKVPLGELSSRNYFENVLVTQKERQTQSLLLDPKNNPVYVKTGTKDGIAYDISEMKAKDDVPQTFRHFVLTALPSLTHENGYLPEVLTGIEDKSPLNKRAKEQLQEVFNSLAALLLGSRDLGKNIVLSLPNVDVQALLAGGDEALPQWEPLLLLLPLMEDLVGQAKGYTVKFVIEAQESSEVDREALRNKLIKVISLYQLADQAQAKLSVVGKWLGETPYHFDGLKDLSLTTLWNKLEHHKIFDDKSEYPVVQDLERTVPKLDERIRQMQLDYAAYMEDVRKAA